MQATFYKHFRGLLPWFIHSITILFSFILCVILFYINEWNQYGFIFKNWIKANFSSLGSRTAIMQTFFFIQSWHSILSTYIYWYILFYIVTEFIRKVWYVPKIKQSVAAVHVTKHHQFVFTFQTYYLLVFWGSELDITCIMITFFKGWSMLQLDLSHSFRNACDVFRPSVYELCDSKCLYHYTVAHVMDIISWVTNYSLILARNFSVNL